MSREFYYQSIVEHFIGENYLSEKYHKYPLLSLSHIFAIQTTLSDSNINVLAFLVSVQELLENENVKNEQDVTITLSRLIQSMKDNIVASKTTPFSELWLEERSVDSRPSTKDQLRHQFPMLLMQVCGLNLIFPLVQIVDSYSRRERFHIDMPVELFDTQGAGRWRVAMIKKIESITASGEIFFYLNYVGWTDHFDEWIPAQSYRIQPIYDKHGDIVHNCKFYSYTDVDLGQEVDYYDQSNSQASGRASSRWKQGKVSKTLWNTVLVENDTDMNWCRCITTHKTFTY